MIEIKEKKDCVGCEACRQVCPKQCISMTADETGALYPIVNKSLCIECGLCEKVCPVIHQNSESSFLFSSSAKASAHERSSWNSGDLRSQSVFAASNTSDKIKAESSSGGVLSALAEAVIAEGGVVFGASFADDWSVEHSLAETVEDASRFRRSKYVQSRIGDNFLKAKKILDEGRKVLFTGTPCQISGLKLFLRKDYGEQLITVDSICHGVPAPEFWRQYLDAVKLKKEKDIGKILTIKSINFRDKRNGWSDYGLSVIFESDDGAETEFFESFKRNPYLLAFIKSYTLRPSCYACPAKLGKSHSDITLADFWGIQKEYPELFEKGYYSLVMVNTELGARLLDKSGAKKEEVDFSIALSKNRSYFKSEEKPRFYPLFQKRFQSQGIEALKIVTNIRLHSKLRKSFYKLLYNLQQKISQTPLTK